MVLDRFGNPRVGDLKDSVEALIVQHNFDLIGIDLLNHTVLVKTTM
jgi:hypothetical protein